MGPNVCNQKNVYFNSVMIENIESYLMGIGERVSFHDNVVVIICSFFTTFDG